MAKGPGMKRTTGTPTRQRRSSTSRKQQLRTRKTNLKTTLKTSLRNLAAEVGEAVAVDNEEGREAPMVELKDEDEGLVSLVMDKEEVPFAVEALLRAGYGLTRPSDEESEAE